MSDNHMLSIIIPHYNSADTLKRLLDSIFSGNDTGIEVIVVDDNSDDKDGLNEVQKHFSDKVMFTVNPTGKNSAGTCRNVGIEKSTGKWVLFCDADDYLVDGWYDVVSRYFDSMSDVIYFRPTSIDFATGSSNGREDMMSRLIDDYIADRSAGELGLRYKWKSPCSKMVRRSLILENKIMFEPVLHGNDVMFSTILGYYTKSLEVCSSAIYCITKLKGSLTNTVNRRSAQIRSEVNARRYYYLKEYLNSRDFKRLKTSRLLFHHILKSVRRGYFGEYMRYLRKLQTGKADAVLK